MNKFINITFVCGFLFLSNTVFSQVRWDSLPGKFQDPNAADVMYADSNYMYTAGSFNEVGGKHMQGIARWNGVKWDSMGTGIDGLYGYATKSQYPPNTWAMTKYHNRLYVGGVFTALGNVFAPAIGTWDGTGWDSIPVQPFKCDSLGSPPTGVVFTTDVINNKLYIGGEFDTVAGQPGVIGIASWNDTNWSSLNFPTNFSFNSINAICEYNGSIYAAGGFSGQNGGIGDILRLDNTGWHSVDTGIKGASAWINSMAVYNGELYVAGYFSKSDGNYGNNIQRWDGTSWSDVGGGTDYQIFNLMVYNNKLYAMGQFTEAGGIPASFIAEWDGNKWCSLGSTFDNSIGTSCVYKDSLYIGGGFWTIDGDSISYIAEWTGGSYVANCGQPTGVSEIKDNTEKVSVYPNPNNGNFTLVIASVTKQSLNTVEIYNVLGEKVYQSNIYSDNSEINLIGQPNGIYLYRVITETGELVGQGKVVVQR